MKGEPWQHCKDCGVDTVEIKEWYFVRDVVWAASGLGRSDGCFCVGCFEARLGRRLTGDDFKCGGDWAGSISARLADRQDIVLDRAGRRRPFEYQPPHVQERWLRGMAEWREAVRTGSYIS